MDELRELTPEEVIELEKMGEQLTQVWCEEEKQYFPSVKTRRGKFYKLETETFTYGVMQEPLPEEYQELMTQEIGRWGHAWQAYMESEYPAEIPRLIGNMMWTLIARKIEREAAELTTVLEKQYEAKNPKPLPNDTMAVIRWNESFKTFRNEVVNETLIYTYRETL